jgi:hypothetical protein
VFVSLRVVREEQRVESHQGSFASFVEREEESGVVNEDAGDIVAS